MFFGASSFDQPLLYCNWQNKSEAYKNSDAMCDGTVTCGWGDDTSCNPAPPSTTDSPTNLPSFQPSDFPSDVPSVEPSNHPSMWRKSVKDSTKTKSPKVGKVKKDSTKTKSPKA